MVFPWKLNEAARAPLWLEVRVLTDGLQSLHTEVETMNNLSPTGLSLPPSSCFPPRDQWPSVHQLPWPVLAGRVRAKVTSVWGVEERSASEALDPSRPPLMQTTASARTPLLRDPGTTSTSRPPYLSKMETQTGALFRKTSRGKKPLNGSTKPFGTPSAAHTKASTAATNSAKS